MCVGRGEGGRKPIPEDFIKLLLQNIIISTNFLPVVKTPSPVVHEVIPAVFKVCSKEGRKQAGQPRSLSLLSLPWATPLRAQFPPCQVSSLRPQFPKFPCHTLPRDLYLPPAPHIPAPAPSALTLWSHHGHLRPCINQISEPLVIFVLIVEAGGGDAQVHVPVLLQEVSHLLCTLEAGAPGYVPGDTVLHIRTQNLIRRQNHITEPIQEAEFCVARIQLGEMERERERGDPRDRAGM